MRLPVRRHRHSTAAPRAADLDALVAYLVSMAARLEGTDRDAVLAAAALLAEFGQFLERTGALS